MAHVIQLSLKELLGRMEMNPRNDKEEIEWTKRDRNAQTENQEIVHTLDKVRFLRLYSFLITYNYIDSTACSLY